MPREPRLSIEQITDLNLLTREELLIIARKATHHLGLEVWLDRNPDSHDVILTETELKPKELKTQAQFKVGQRMDIDYGDDSFYVKIIQIEDNKIMLERSGVPHDQRYLTVSPSKLRKSIRV